MADKSDAWEKMPVFRKSTSIQTTVLLTDRQAGSDRESLGWINYSCHILKRKCIQKKPFKRTEALHTELTVHRLNKLEF